VLHFEVCLFNAGLILMHDTLGFFLSCSSVFLTMKFKDTKIDISFLGQKARKRE
jgi:hypothetical protein